MARRYTKSRKAEILKQLDANAGDVVLTSLQCGIPDRTLRDWKRAHLLQSAAAETNRQRRQEQGSEPPPFPAESAMNFETLNNVLMDKAFRIAASLSEGLDDSPVHQRMFALAHLIDRILRLNAALPKADEDNAIRIEFIAPDGTVHDNIDNLAWDEDEEWEEKSRKFFSAHPPQNTVD